MKLIKMPNGAMINPQQIDSIKRMCIDNMCYVSVIVNGCEFESPMYTTKKDADDWFNDFAKKGELQILDKSK